MIKWKKLFYKGAGILFVFSEQKGTYEILLGKRRCRPHRGYWDIPGGGMSRRRDEGGFLNCARRETCEEFMGYPECGSPDECRKRFEKCLKGCIPSSFDVQNPPRTVVKIPFFEFHTYLFPLTGKPENFPILNCEFTRDSWCNVEKLPERPEKVHPGVRYSLWRFSDLKKSFFS